MTTVPDRQRLPFLVVVAIAAVVLVVGAIVVLPTMLPGPTPTPSPTATLSTGPSPDPSTPEGATRAFFEAVAEARRVGDAEVVLPFTTGRGSSAFLTIDGFVRGQREAGKASILTRNEIVDARTEVAGEEATIRFLHRQEGFDIDLDTGEPLESPTPLPDRDVRVDLRLVDGRWLVERFEVSI